MENQEKTNEEVTLEEAAVEEAAVEEAVVEELIEETQEVIQEEVQEKVQEEVQEETTKKSNVWKYILIGAGVFVAMLAVIYLTVSRYYSDKFFMGTSVNGIECSGKTVDEVRAILQKEVEEYFLTIKTANDNDTVIKGTDIGIKYKGVDVIEEAFEKQNQYLWMKALLEKKNIEANVEFEYDTAKVEEVIKKADFMKPENQIPSVSAVPVYANGKYDIQAEVYGTQILEDKLYASVKEAIDDMDKVVDLTEKQCYVQPIYKKDSKQVIEANNALNKCLEANITYSLDGIEVKVDRSMIGKWISVDTTNMSVNIDAAKVRAFTDTLGGKYNTPNKTGQITTPTGKVATIPNAQLGRIVGAAAECEQLMKEIREGKVVTREPLLSQSATPEGATSWGATYIEVDISAQHMWYILDGAVVFECDVVTGSPGRDTPVGSFKILEKLRNKTLRGNIMPNGKPEYITPVSYWARVTWSGIGFHDAEWQWPPKGQGFGGELYKQGYGSHGCINMALKDVSVFYEMIQVGCPVLIHY